MMHVLRCCFLQVLLTALGVVVVGYDLRSARRMEATMIPLVSRRGAKEIERMKEQNKKNARVRIGKYGQQMPVKADKRVHVILPIVTLFKNAVSDDLREALVAYQNKQLWINDITSKGRRCLRAPFRTDYGAGLASKGPFHPETKQMPVIPLGKNRALLGTQYDRIVDEALFEFANHLVNIPINGINHVKAQLREGLKVPEKAPEPQISISMSKFCEYMEEVKAKNPSYFEKNADGQHVFHPIDNESAYWPTPETFAEDDSINDEAENETTEVPIAAPTVTPVSAAPTVATAPTGSATPGLGINTDALSDTGTDNGTDTGSTNSSPDARVPDPDTRAPTNTAAPTADLYFIPNQNQNLQINNASKDCGSYKYHQDAADQRGGMLVSELGRPATIEAYGDGDPLVLPWRQRMFVLTQICGDNTMTAETAVDWVVGNNEWLGGAITGNNGMHMQWMGVQYRLIQYGVTNVWNRDSFFKGARLIMTYRFVADPNRDSLVYLCGAFHDEVLPRDIDRRKGMAFLHHATETNPISERRTLPPGEQDKKISQADRCYKKWKAACEFDGLKHINTDVVIFPPSLPQDRTPFKVEPGNKILALPEEMMAFFQLETIPARDSSGQSASGFLKKPDVAALLDDTAGSDKDESLLDDCLDHSERDGALSESDSDETKSSGNSGTRPHPSPVAVTPLAKRSATELQSSDDDADPLHPAAKKSKTSTTAANTPASVTHLVKPSATELQPSEDDADPLPPPAKKSNISTTAANTPASTSSRPAKLLFPSAGQTGDNDTGALTKYSEKMLSGVVNRKGKIRRDIKLEGSILAQVVSWQSSPHLVMGKLDTLLKVLMVPVLAAKLCLEILSLTLLCIPPMLLLICCLAMPKVPLQMMLIILLVSPL